MWIKIHNFGFDSHIHTTRTHYHFAYILTYCWALLLLHYIIRYKTADYKINPFRKPSIDLEHKTAMVLLFYLSLLI